MSNLCPALSSECRARMPRASLAFLWLFALVSLTAGSRGEQPAATGPAQAEESYRHVAARDEIISVLDNGMTVIVKRVASPVVAVRAYAKTGGVYEGRWLGGGLSHLLEHLVAGGTNQRRTEQQNRNLLQKLGNDSNAYTTYDHTCYYVNTTTEHLADAVDLVAGWVLGAKITPEEYAREYEVVQRELEMGKGEPDRVFWKLIQANRYRIHPARVPVIGYQQVIQGLSRDDVYAYYRLAYQPNNLVFAVAGDIDPEKMLEVVQKNVAAAQTGREFPNELPDEPPVLAPRTVAGTFANLGQARLDLGFPTVRLDHPDLYALDLLATILGSGESSILVEELRDRRRIVSSVSVSSYTPSFVEGTFSVTMELDAAKIEEAKAAVFEQVEQVKASLVDDARIARAKTQMRVARVRSLQKAEEIIASLATDWLSAGDAHFGDRYIERIERVTAGQIQDVARRYLDPSRLLTTALLPAESPGARSLPKAEDLLRPVAPTTQPEGEIQETKVTRLELDSGVTLLHKRIATTPLVEIRMYALGGLTAEDEKTNGLGNFAMEMLPRGTTTRSARQIAEFFDSIGGSLETDCGNNSWYWNLTCLKGDLPKAMEVYADVVRNPAFAESEVPAVRQRILAEIESQDADWHTQAMRFFRRSFFGPTGSPYQFLAVGNKEIVGQATAEQVRKWYETKVMGSRRVLAIFGDVSLEEAKTLARQHPLGASEGEQESAAVINVRSGPAFTIGAEPMPAPDPEPIQVAVQRVDVQQTAQPLAGVVIGFKANLVINEPLPPLTIIDTMSSGYTYPTGYLHDILRGRGLVYVVHAATMPGVSGELPGTFYVYAGCDPQNVNEVVELILENIARCQGSEQDMQAGWFDRSKMLITTGEALQNETAADQASTAALDELFGLGYDYHDRFAERIDAVTIDQVRSVARSRLAECIVTVSTPLPDVVDRKTGVRTYRMFPPVDLAPRGVQHDAAK